MKKKVNNLEELEKTAISFLKNNKKRVIILNGDLGAGKTTFVKLIGKNLGILENINSPTFVISKKYQIKKNKLWKELIHIDAYRLQRKEDLKNIGFWNDLENTQKIIFIEWGKNIEKFLPKKVLQKNTQKINFEYLGKNKRLISFP